MQTIKKLLRLCILIFIVVLAGFAAGITGYHHRFQNKRIQVERVEEREDDEENL
jgi:hypothetical protein